MKTSALQGPSVMSAIEAFKPVNRTAALRRPLRLPIIDVFKGQRGGLSIGGKVEGGALKASTCAHWSSAAVLTLTAASLWAGAILR